MEMTISEIAALTGGTVVGDGSRVVRGLSQPGDGRMDAICVVWEKKRLAQIPEGVAVMAERGTLEGRDGVELDRPRDAMPKILAKFDRRARPAPGIHPSAVIAEDAVIGERATIGPLCVVSRGAVIGAGTVLEAQVYIGEGVTVGDGCFFEPCVAILAFCRVGSRVRLHSGVKVGCDGFGFIPTGPAQWEKVPQIGDVMIEDDVEIGSNCSVDRAMFGTTRIGAGTKLGSLIHVAHNCDLGRGVVMSGFSAMSGSVTIGDGTIVAGMVGIADHVCIGSGVTIAGRSGITKDVKDGMTVAGYPAQEHAKENRLQASLRRVPSLTERIKELERQIALLRTELGEGKC